MMTPIGVGLTALGRYLPASVRRNEDWPPSFRDRVEERVRQDLLHRVEHAVKEGDPDVDREVAAATGAWVTDPFRGSRQRRVMAGDQTSSDMETAAAQAALDARGCTAEDVDLLLVYAQVPDFPSPADHALVAHKLGCRQDVATATVDVGCASFVPQVAMACRLVQCGEYSRAMIVVSSAISRITDYGAPSSVNVGDGALAAIVERIDDDRGYVAQSQVTRGHLHGGIRMVPESNADGLWYRGDENPGRLVARSTDPAATHEMGAHAASMCRDVTERVLRKAGVTIDDIAFFCIAQSTAWFPTAMSEAVGIGPERMLGPDVHFARYGHMLPASLPMNLYVAASEGRLRDGDLVLMFSPGAGFTTTAMLYRWSDLALSS